MNITPVTLRNKYADELTLQELIFVHLYQYTGGIEIKDRVLRSTLSFIMENINHGFSFERAKILMPLLSCLSVLDQLGICYERTDMQVSRFDNGIKRALYYFGEFEEDDPIINTLYALRNGLLHNVSLVSIGKNNHFHFRYDSQINGIYQPAQIKWDGKFDTLDGTNGEYTTSISPDKIKELVQTCINYAFKLNMESKLKLRLKQGIKELYFSYIRYA
jgi:hypothetical protein